MRNSQLASFRHVSALLLLACMGCGGGSKNTEAVQPGAEVECPSGSVNSGKTIITMDCNTVVQFEGNEFEGTLDVAGYGKAGLHNARKALREIDQSATDAQVQFTQTCRVYNSCQMASEEFNRELSRAQARFREMREKVALLQASGGNPEVLRKTLAEAYQLSVPEQKRLQSSLAANLVVQVKDPASSAARVLKEGDTLHTGAEVAVGLEVNQSAYVYVFQRHQDKGLDVLFPNAQIQNLNNPIEPGTRVRIPPGGQVFRLNNEDLGDEQLHVVASLRPLSDLEAALSRAGAASEPVEGAMDSLFDEAAPECADKTRGLEVTSEECGNRTRGLELANSGSDDFFEGESSARARTAPGDDVVVQSLTFRHVE